MAEQGGNEKHTDRHLPLALHPLPLVTRRCSLPHLNTRADQAEQDKEMGPSVPPDKEMGPSVPPVRMDPAIPATECSISLLPRRPWWSRMKEKSVAYNPCHHHLARDVFGRRGWRRTAAVIVFLLVAKTWSIQRCDGAVVKIGFLVDWGQQSPLYPGAAAAAAEGAAEALRKSGVFSSWTGPGDDTAVTMEWVWHDTACNADMAYEAAEILLDVYGVDMIVGPACCRAAAVASVLAHRRGVPVISWACSAEYLSDKTLYPSFLRVVGSSADFAAAVGALFRRHGWDRTSILYAQGATRGLTHSTEAWQMRRVLEAQEVSIGAWEAFDGSEACLVGAGDALGVRRAVEAAEGWGDDVIIVAGECADYRQVMTHAASSGLVRSGRVWILLGGARDPACHVSASTCGRDDGRDALALSSMSGSLSIDWSSRSNSRANPAAYANAAAAYNRESFAAEYTPPPGGNASPVCSFCSSVENDVTPGPGHVHGRGWRCLGSQGVRRSCSFLSRVCAVDNDGGGDCNRGFNRGVSVSVDGGDCGPNSEPIPSALCGGKGDESEGVKERLECHGKESTSFDQERNRNLGPYEAVPPGAPLGVLQAAALMYDAAELGGRLLVAAAGANAEVGAEAGAEFDAMRLEQDGDGWSGLAAAVEFEGLSGTVKVDSNGNRYGMDVSFWVVEGKAIDGFSYTWGTEAARFTQDTGHVQFLREIEWPAAKQQQQQHQQLLQLQPVDVLPSTTRVTLLFGFTVLTVATVILVMQHLEIRRQKRRQQQQHSEGVTFGVDVAVPVPGNSHATGQAGGVVTSSVNSVTPSEVSASSNGRRLSVDETGSRRVSPAQSLSPEISSEPGEAAATAGVLNGGRGSPTQPGNAVACADSEGFSTGRSVPLAKSECSAEGGGHAVSSLQKNDDAVNSVGNNDKPFKSPGFSISAKVAAVAADVANSYATFPRRFGHASGVNSRSSESDDRSEVRSVSRKGSGMEVGGSSGNENATATFASPAAVAAAAGGDGVLVFGDVTTLDERRTGEITPPTTNLSLLPSESTSASGTPALSPPPGSTCLNSNGDRPRVGLGMLDQRRDTAPPQGNRPDDEEQTVTDRKEEDNGHPEGSFDVDGSTGDVDATAVSSPLDASDSCTYSSAFAAFTPLSEERLRIVEDELKRLSDRAKQALEEIEVDGCDISIGAIVGSGSFAEVRRGRLRNTNSCRDGPPTESKISATVISRRRNESPEPTEIALKVLRDVKRQTLRRFWFEVLIMKDLDHPNIVRLLGASWRERRLMMIMEFVTRGNLAAVLEEGPQLTWKDQKFDMCLDIAKGMAYLHRYKYFDELSNSLQNCVIHRDLKPQNLLVTSDFRVKITDFGEATGKGNDAACTQVGTLLYVAPEIVRGDRYDERCDVYSFAVVLLAMLQLREDVIMLFGEEVLRRNKEKPKTRATFTHMAITNSIVNEDLRPTLPEDVFGTLRVLIEQCWAPTPALRPTFEEILEFLDEIARDEIVKGHIVHDDRDITPGSKDGDALEGTPGNPTPITAGAAAAAASSGPSQTSGVPAIASSVDSTPSEAVLVLEKAEAAAAVRQAQEVESQGEMMYQEMFPPMVRGKKRGKNYRPAKGNMGMEFLEKHKELSGWKSDVAPYTILEEEEQSESDDTVAVVASENSAATAGIAAAAVAPAVSWASRRLATQGLSGAAGSSASAATRSRFFPDDGKVRNKQSPVSTNGSTDEGVLENRPRVAGAANVVQGVPSVGGESVRGGSRAGGVYSPSWKTPKAIESILLEACFAEEGGGVVEKDGDRRSGETNSIGGQTISTMTAKEVATLDSMSTDWDEPAEAVYQQLVSTTTGRRRSEGIGDDIASQERGSIAEHSGARDTGSPKRCASPKQQQRQKKKRESRGVLDSDDAGRNGWLDKSEPGGRGVGFGIK